MVVLLILLIVTVIAFVGGFVREQLLSRKTEKRFGTRTDNIINEKKFKNKKFVSPILTCDYCGSLVNTAKESKCPNCGASYEFDEEWIHRYENEYNYVDDTANKGVHKFDTYGSANNQKTNGSGPKRLAIITFVLFGIFALLGIFAKYFPRMDNNKFNEDSKLNEASYENYELVDYQIEGDGVLIDSDDIKLTIKNIYKDSRSYTNGNLFKVEFEVVNNSDKDVKVVAKSTCINDYSDDSFFIYFNENVRKNKTVTFYERVYDVSKSEIKNMIFSNIYVDDMDSNSIYESDKAIEISTTSTINTDYDFTGKALIYSNEYVDIYSTYNKAEDNNKYINYDDDGFKFLIHNKTDYDFEVNDNDLKINNKTLSSTYGLYDEFLPRNTVFETGGVYSYDEEFTDIKNKDIYFSFKFDCLNDPSKSFQTEYLNLHELYWQ
ncbi:hypothetical protein [Lachnospira multipara]|uniref:hypothetical protein n=1 Tax=Lachnospira multipara TaxID=28051 RepID=UPI0004814E31|nr:hypothetical protein [Lachnospira multipara]